MTYQNTPILATPATRTVAGYDVKITAFIPVDTNDVDAQIESATAVKAAANGEAGAIASLLGMAINIEIGQKFVTRRVLASEVHRNGNDNE